MRPSDFMLTAAGLGEFAGEPMRAVSVDRSRRSMTGPRQPAWQRGLRTKPRRETWPGQWGAHLIGANCELGAVMRLAARRGEPLRTTEEVGPPR